MKRMRRVCAGFTLFEVMISLTILSMSVLTVLMLIPTGLQAQQQARLKLLAAVKAEEMIEMFSKSILDNPGADNEGANLWDIHAGRCSQTWDLEKLLSNPSFGLIPVPLDIARRLDSENDEIARIIANGGSIYYSRPQSLLQTKIHVSNASGNKSPPNETQLMIIAIAGSAQQNSIYSFPLKSWPYYSDYPSPPMHVEMQPSVFVPPVSASPYQNYYNWPSIGNDNEFWVIPWEPISALPQSAQGVDDMQVVYSWLEGTERYGYMPYTGGRLWDKPVLSGFANPNGVSGTQFTTNFPRRDFGLHVTKDTGLNNNTTGVSSEPGRYGTYPSRQSCVKYVQAALWYYKKVTGSDPVSAASLGIVDNQTSFNASYKKNPALPSPALPSDGSWDADAFKHVQAWRFLAHASMCLMSWYPQAELRLGIDIPSVTLRGEPSPIRKITDADIKFYHERSVFLAYDFAARFPYDWSVPRPGSRPQMMDIPLMQWDLFSPALPDGGVAPSGWPTSASGFAWTNIFGRSATDNPRQWRPISAQDIKNIGVSICYPALAIDSAQRTYADSPTYGPLFGNRDHFNLTNKFEAYERCREIVIWSADWMNYVDSETAPSAPVDASRYPLAAAWATNSNDIRSDLFKNFDKRMGNGTETPADNTLMSFNNPEKAFLYTEDMSSVSTETEVSKKILGYVNAWERYNPMRVIDLGYSLVNRKIFYGAHGADRNNNQRLDRGLLPPSVRLKAVQISRYNFYDPRVPTWIR